MFPDQAPSATADQSAAGELTPLTLIMRRFLGVRDFEIQGQRILTDLRPYTEADEPGKNANPAGPNGDHMCDAPFTLEASMYKAINEIVPDAAFTIFTGDIVDHAIWNTSQAYNSAISRFPTASVGYAIEVQ